MKQTKLKEQMKEIKARVISYEVNVTFEVEVGNRKIPVKMIEEFDGNNWNGQLDSLKDGEPYLVAGSSQIVVNKYPRIFKHFSEETQKRIIAELVESFKKEMKSSNLEIFTLSIDQTPKEVADKQLEDMLWSCKEWRKRKK